MKPLKILFADDDLKYSLLLKRFLEKEGYEVTYVGNGRMAVEQFPLVRPDLVLLDINMPELNGFEVAARIREADKHVLLFFLSDRSDKADRLQGFSLRANDYLAKPFYPEELIARIRERFALQMEETVDEETYRFGNTVFNYNTNELRTASSKVLITSRQADILRLLALNVNNAVPRDQLLEAVWGAVSYANSLALNVQITYLRKALKNDPSVRIESLMKKGYVLKG
ncbi:response regulator transcription factor [uncultured Mediterranea sp.]|uniref:response regulator transcription factor n=1 Tax=uncultured Mediterranea sp. TaxID=1926662 RepID=UPI0028057969|nr:response regulator transcription factor [uncultured Mediterranea sp.]